VAGGEQLRNSDFGPQSNRARGKKGESDAPCSRFLQKISISLVDAAEK